MKLDHHLCTKEMHEKGILLQSSIAARRADMCTELPENSARQIGQANPSLRSDEDDPGCVLQTLASFSASFASLGKTALQSQSVPTQHKAYDATGQRQWTPGCSRKGHQSRNKTYRNSTCTEQMEPFSLQLVTLRHWSSCQPPQLALQTPVVGSNTFGSRCSRVVRCRCKECPHHNRRRTKSVRTGQLQSLGAVAKHTELTGVRVRRRLAVKRSCLLQPLQQQVILQRQTVFMQHCCSEIRAVSLHTTMLL